MGESKTLKPKDYVHLHNHSQYSLLDGLTKVPALLDRVTELGMGAVAITDHGTLSGAIEFYKEAKTRGINPVIGMEAYIASRTIAERDPVKDKTYYHLIILAMNNKGYQNLMALSTIANLEGVYYKPRIDHELLEKYHEGLIVLSGCIGGEVGDLLRQGQDVQAVKTAKWYKKVFGDRYYLELQDHGHPKHPSRWDIQTQANKKLLTMGEDLKIPCVVTCDAHYLRHGDQQAHEILLCVQTGAFLSDPKRMSLKEFDLHVNDPTEVIERWGKTNPELIINSRKIAERCNVEIDLGKILIPKFPVPKQETEMTLLHKMVYRGLAWRYGGCEEQPAQLLSEKEAIATLPSHVKERAQYELGVIDAMGFNGYFLIIADFIGWGKRHRIVFGPGRGSAAGSIISYALKITELDPLKYDLLFERFLNPDRISMPDIDIDIQDSRRDEVIEYCVNKYGANRVANIVTFGKMAARNAVRDVARVLQVPYADADRLAKMIPPPVQGRHILLKTSLQANFELKHEYDTNEQARQVFDLAVQLEGTIRSHGVHAAGVVIAPDDIVKFTPLEMAQKGVVATQYSMGPIEDLGLLKIDFLGLSNLTVIKNALRIIKKVHGRELTIGEIPMEDEKTFELLSRGDTTGVFQLESAGMKRYLKELKPTVFDDIIAMVALYRPGPMQWIEDFIARKYGKRKIEYLHPAMEAALRSTYGIIVYQEQVMQISKEMCGFSGGQADTLRKAIGKKKPEELAKMKTAFIEGAIKTVGADKRTMEKFWSQLEAFAAYCFPKAHAACYGLIAYQTAYLKANFPPAFMAALMTSDYDNIDRLAIEINECKHMGVNVLPPDVNESFVEFAVVPGVNQIRFGMAAIKNVGRGAVEEVLRAREQDGAFNSLEDFLSKVNVRTVNRKALESLIKAGAFDRFGERGNLLDNLDVMLAFASRMQKELSSGQTDLFGNIIGSSDGRPKLLLKEARGSRTVAEQLQWERELIGIYLSQHPLDSYEVLLSEQTVSLSALKPELEGRAITIGGAIMDVREITTKKGQKMAFVKIADKATEFELILFPTIYQQTTGIWDRDRVIIAKGKLNSTDKAGNSTSEMKMLVDDVREITYEQATAYQATGKKKPPPKATKKNGRYIMAADSDESSAPKRVYIRLDSGRDQELLGRLKKVIDDCLGTTEVVLVLGQSIKKQIIRLPMKFNDDDSNLSRLHEIVGAENVKIH